MDVALGEIYSGVFSVRIPLERIHHKTPHSYIIQTSDTLWDELRAAGEAEHDRFWRMPIDEEYGPQIYSSNADLQNVSASRFIAFCDIDFGVDGR
jgi:aminopeptidase